MLNLKRTKIGNTDWAGGGAALAYLKNGLPKDFPYVGLSGRLSGRLTISGGTTSGTPWPEGPITLASRIRVFGTKKGGAVEVVNIDGPSLFEIMHYFSHTKYEQVPISSGAAASYDFVQTIFVPLHVPGLNEKYQAYSLLPGWWFDDLELEIQWRDGTLVANGGLIAGGDRALAVSAYGGASGVPTISWTGIQALNINHNVHNPALFKLYKKTIVTEQVESNRKEPLNRGGFYRAILFRTYSIANGVGAAAAAETPSDAINQDVRLLVSGNSKEDWVWNELKSKNKQDYNIETVDTGYAMMDFCPNGEPSTMLDTRDFVTNGISLEAGLDINGAVNNRHDIICMETVPAGMW